MHVNHLITQYYCCMTEITFIYNLGVSGDLEYNFLDWNLFTFPEAVQISIIMISGVDKKSLLGNSGQLRNHIWA